MNFVTWTSSRRLNRFLPTQLRPRDGECGVGESIVPDLPVELRISSPHCSWRCLRARAGREFRSSFVRVLNVRALRQLDVVTLRRQETSYISEFGIFFGAKSSRVR